MNKYVSQLNGATYKKEFTSVIEHLVDSYYKVNDLAYQQSMLTRKLLKPLPLLPTQANAVPKVLYHLFGDLDGTDLFNEFNGFVNGLVNAATDQEKKIGAIVQVSGYGKTHIARAYTSTCRALYILLTDEIASTEEAQNVAHKTDIDRFFEEKFAVFKDTESTLKDVDLDKELVVEREFARVVRMSDLCQRIVRLFMLAAIEYYTDFIDVAAPLVAARVGSNYSGDHPDLLKLGSLLFNKGCLYYFLRSKLPPLYANYHNDAWWDSYLDYVMPRQSTYKVKAVFCDEVHSLMKKHVGICFHENILTSVIQRKSPNLVAPPTKWQELFDKYDNDKDGFLLLTEFKQFCEENQQEGPPLDPEAYWNNDEELKVYPAMSVVHFVRLLNPKSNLKESSLNFDSKLKALQRRLYEAGEKPQTSGRKAAYAEKFRNVTNLSQRPTSLTYLIVSCLEFMTKKLSNFSAVCLTTNYSAVKYKDQNKKSTRASLVFEVFQFNREPSHLFNQYATLFKQHFGEDLETILHSEDLRNAFSTRALYMTYLFDKVMMKNNNGQCLQEATARCQTRAQYYLDGLNTPEFSNLYSKAIVAVMLHNSLLRENLDPKYELDHGCLPVVKKLSTNTCFMITDHFMSSEIRAQVASNYDVLVEAIHKCFNDQPDLAGKFGETLMAYIALKNRGKLLKNLSIVKSFFMKGPLDAEVPDPLADNAFLQTELCASSTEFDLEDMTLLKEPLKYLDTLMVKPKDTTKPDGLSLCKSGNEFIVTAWQSKYWANTISASELRAAALSLNPTQFFQENTANRSEWIQNLIDDQQLQQVWVNKYIRVFIARKFGYCAIDMVNAWNEKPDNVNQPVLLVQFEDHLTSELEKQLLTNVSDKLPAQAKATKTPQKKKPGLYKKATEAFAIIVPKPASKVPKSAPKSVLKKEAPKPLQSKKTQDQGIKRKREDDEDDLNERPKKKKNTKN